MIDDRDLTRHLEEGGDLLWNPPEPPPLDLAAITGAAPAPVQVRRAATVATPVGRWRERRPGRSFLAGPLGLAAGATACVALGVAIGALIVGGGAAPTQLAGTSARATVPAPAPSTAAVLDEEVDLHPLGDAPARALAVASVFSGASGKRVDLRITGLPPLRNGTFYEVWALGKKGKMVSLGTVSVDQQGNGETSMRLPVSLNRFPVLDISLERADGNPAHSGHSLLRAPV